MPTSYYIYKTDQFNLSNLYGELLELWWYYYQEIKILEL